jgi:hypothetical protein
MCAVMAYPCSGPRRARIVSTSSGSEPCRVSGRVGIPSGLSKRPQYPSSSCGVSSLRVKPGETVEVALGRLDDSAGPFTARTVCDQNPDAAAAMKQFRRAPNNLRVRPADSDGYGATQMAYPVTYRAVPVVF